MRRLLLAVYLPAMPALAQAQGEAQAQVHAQAQGQTQVHVQGQAQAGPGATAESLVAYARARNPEVAAMRYEAEAAAQRVQPAGALPDPVIRTELQNITNAGSGARPSLFPSRIGGTRYLLMQPVPFPGKRELKREAAQADSEQAQGRAAVAWVEVAARIRAEHARHYYLSRNLRLTGEILALTARLEAIAHSRYASGLAPQQDVIRAQIEQTGLRGELIALEGEQRQVRARINALLARSAEDPLPEPDEPAALPPSERLEPAGLIARARAANPELAAEAARVRAAQSGRELAYRNRFPDFVLGVAPVQMGSRINEWELMIEMNIPLQQESRRSQEREAEAMLAAARSRNESTAHRVFSELVSGASAIEAARRSQHLAATSLLPQAQLTLRSALAAYETGKVDFATLLDAQREVRKARQELLKAQVDGQMRLAELERLVGEAP